MLVAFFNWGLGLIFGAILARKIGDYSIKNNIKFYYSIIYIMPKFRDDNNSPKMKKGKYNLRRRKKKQLEKKCHKDSDNDSDSSSDYDPKEDNIEDMNSREIQKFIQKLFPSKTFCKSSFRKSFSIIIFSSIPS